MKAVNDDGLELDALFAVGQITDGFEIILESRGGSDHGPRRSRNKDYAVALALLLRRMAHYGLTIQSIEIASSRTASLSSEQRRLHLFGHPYPIDLSTLRSVEPLRLELGRASAAYGRPPGKTTGGNPTKKLRLRIVGPQLREIAKEEFERLLVQPPSGTTPSGRSWSNVVREDSDDIAVEKSVWTEPSTADPEALAASVKALMAKRQKWLSPTLPPKGSPGLVRTIGEIARFVRDPNVIVWVLESAEGLCEVCSAPAPFERLDGSLYLEVHHVRPLGEGGPDTTDNAVAACPNCHRRLHHGSDRAELRAQTITKVTRLVDYPRKSIAV